jgi:hypothetical protein
MLLISFIPSVRKILFFQKKIKQLNVEFIVRDVLAQSRASFTLSHNIGVFFEAIANPMQIITGIYSTTKQATASKQLDIFLNENVFFVLGGIPLFLRVFLAIMNSL